MLRRLSLLFLLFTCCGQMHVHSQTYPSYGPEKDVTIIGLTFDAMEPFISFDGNTLFFNNLNDGNTTKLFYATRINDSTFNYVGEVNGTNQTVIPYLDAVADMDSSGYFLWTSTRNYPVVMENLHRGTYSAGSVTNISRIYGDFNIYIPGWLIMDHGISTDGQFLYANNARFNAACTGPCNTYLQIAQRVNDSTFNVIPESEGILQNINDSVNYIYYAPFITHDNRELYYTRYPKGTITPSTTFDICVAVRATPTDTFSAPQVLFSNIISSIIEAPTLTPDKNIMYYHKKESGVHVIKMRYRNQVADISSMDENSGFTVYPNPASERIQLIYPGDGRICLYQLTDLNGRIILQSFFQDACEIDLSQIEPGTYILHVQDGDQISSSQQIILY